MGAFQLPFHNVHNGPYPLSHKKRNEDKGADMDLQQPSIGPPANGEETNSLLLPSRGDDEPMNQGGSGKL